jgi:hypothetical protein
MAMRPDLVDDSPISGDRLRPGLRRMAARLADILSTAPPTSPLLVSGDWGSGKTSLLREVQRLLDLDETRCGAAIWFDAWHYEGCGPLLPALIRRVWDSVPLARRTDERARGLLRRLLAAAIRVTAGGLPALVRAAGVPFAPEALDRLALGDRVAETLKEDEPGPDPVADLRRDFAKLIEGAWGTPPGFPRTPGNQAFGRPFAGGDAVRPVVFVDDLDRCSPAGAVGLLDSIRMLVSGADQLGCRFVVALDRGVVAQAITAKFPGIRGYDGNRYLEKIFPLEFQVPMPGPEEASDMIRDLLGDRDVDRSLTALWAALSNLDFRNPRLMKRCLNRFRLALYLEEGTPPLPSGDEHDVELAQWIAATERWPRLRRIQRSRAPSFWQSACTHHAAGRAADDVELAVLLEEPGALAWLRLMGFPNEPDRLNRFDAADGRLIRCGL